jgi:hypothetical protein
VPHVIPLDLLSDFQWLPWLTLCNHTPPFQHKGGNTREVSRQSGNCTIPVPARVPFSIHLDPELPMAHYAGDRETGGLCRFLCDKWPCDSYADGLRRRHKPAVQLTDGAPHASPNRTTYGSRLHVVHANVHHLFDGPWVYYATELPLQLSAVPQCVRARPAVGVSPCHVQNHENHA